MRPDVPADGCGCDWNAPNESAARKRVSVNPEVEAKLRAVEEKVWIPAVPSAALRRLLDRFLDWRYYGREYRLARLRGQSQYMPPPRERSRGR